MAPSPIVMTVRWHRSAVPRRTPPACERVFVAWLRSTDRPDVVQLDGTDAPAIPLDRVLGALATSRRPLHGELAALLGLRGGTRVGDVAVALLLAVKDPGGPRCASYADAARHLRELAVAYRRG